MDLSKSRRVCTVFLIILFAGDSVASNDCQYKRYVSGLLPGFLLHRNVTIEFPELATAKDVCNLLGNECKGINLRNTRYSRSYVLASSGDVSYARGRLAWRKTCRDNCDFRLTVDYVRRRSYYRKTCDLSQIPEAKFDRWSNWMPWGACSQSCGQLGEQLRFRQCRNPGKNPQCTGNSYQRRVCNFARKCPQTLSDVFGVYGTEGFQIAGSTPVYSTCIRTEQEEKTACGADPNNITREKCTQQYDCCYANDTMFSLAGGPRCFEPKRFIGSSGLIGWSVWSPWTICSQSCANGTRSRSRICTGSIPSSAACSGPDSETEICSLGLCPCAVNPCHNGGACVPDNSISRGYLCQCPTDFIGKHCDYAKPNLACGNDSITVSFDRRVIPDEGLIDDVQYIHFQGHESSQCYAQLNEDQTEYTLSIPPPIDRSCGSSVNVTGEEYTIRNKVLWRLSDQSASSTVVLLDLTCVYDKQLNMTTGLGFGIQPTVRTLAVQTQRSTFHVDMRLYRSPDYSPSSLFVESPTVAEGEVLYVSVDLRTISITNPENEALVLDRCYATDTSESRRPVYDFIRNGCPTNPGFTTVIENGISSRGRWGFRVFEWATLSETSDIFIVCKVFVCDIGFEVCLPSCDDPEREIPTVEGGESSLESKAVIQDLLDSLISNQNYNNSRKRRYVKSDGTKATLDDITMQKQTRKKKDREIYHKVVSKRIKIKPDGVVSNVLNQQFAAVPKHRRIPSSSTEDEGLAYSLTSMFLVGFGSVVVYVLLNYAVKSIMANCSHKISQG